VTSRQKVASFTVETGKEEADARVFARNFDAAIAADSPALRAIAREVTSEALHRTQRKTQRPAWRAIDLDRR
jgi:hypothetical protein